MSTMIEFINVSKFYQQQQIALQQINFTMKPGEMAFLTGHSGAGKTTLLKLIMLLDKPSQGQIMIAGRNLNLLHRRHIPYYRRKLGIVLQTPQFLPDQNTFTNIALPLLINAQPQLLIKRRVHAALDMVGLLNKEKCLPTESSAGEQQRLTIARAIVHKPVIVLADEPTGNLDPDCAKDIMNLFQKLSDAGVTLLIASHDLALISLLPHRLLTLKHGQLIE